MAAEEAVAPVAAEEAVALGDDPMAAEEAEDAVSLTSSSLFELLI